MKTFVLQSAKVYDENQKLIPANKLNWQTIEGLSFETYDEANIRRISMQAVNDREYISVKTINKKYGD